MQLISYLSETGPRIAGRRADAWIDLARSNPELPTCMKRFLALGADGVETAAAAIAAAPSDAVVATEGLRLLPVVPKPEKILCIGLNYADHARETGVETPIEPVVFAKFPSALAAHREPIVLPRCSRQVDYEAELVIVIGREGKNVPAADAAEHIAGYCCGNDVSARDWQFGKPGAQWILGKSFDTFAPVGPALTTADEIADPNQLTIQLRVNGRVLQESSTREFIFSTEQLIAYLSQVCTLRPGDLIFTGTPPGVGMARQPPIFLAAGDLVEVEIDGLGVLQNPVMEDSIESDSD